MLFLEKSKRTYKIIFRIVIFILFFVVLWIVFHNKRQQFFPQTMTARSVVSVVRVVDGDTIEVLVGEKKEKVRLIGINAGELGDTRKPFECFAREASFQMKKLVDGKTIQLESDATQGDRDVYGRLLRYVYLEDGTEINRNMIEQGFHTNIPLKGPNIDIRRNFRMLNLKRKLMGLDFGKRDYVPKDGFPW